ncbi:hypothetical protein M3Y94_00683400 [Aphelenchoides besseyi]|nr:hypothetical protein M3Y94_00683400 [Aphelenchoides besseyi]
MDVGDASAACVDSKIGNDTRKIDDCQSQAYKIMWTRGNPLDFTYSANVTKDTKFDMLLGDENCSLSITSVKDNDSYVLNYRSYKAESGSFNLHLTADGKLQTGDNTVVCANVTIEKAFASNGVKYYAISNVDKFSVTLKGKDIDPRIISQILTITTTSTVAPSSTTTSGAETISLSLWMAIVWCLVMCS